MNNKNEKRIIVEQGLRYRVQIKNQIYKKMSLLDRMAYYKIPGVSIAFINNGVIEWSKGYGSIAVDNHTLITPNTLFQAASISKLVAALGILKLVQQEKLDLDRNINNYLKTWKVPENEFTKIEKVTLRRLLSHSAGTSISGFPGHTQNQKLPTTFQILEGIKPANTEPVRVMRIPGTQFQYSGGGTTIIQQVIEDITCIPFQKWMKEAVLNPLGMKSSTYEQPLPEIFLIDAAYGHLPNGKTVAGYWHAYPEMAAAGLWTTPSDLARVAIALQSALKGDVKGILTPDSVDQLLSPQCLINGDFSTGLGVFLYHKMDNLIFLHDGLNEGFSARLYMHSTQNQGVVIMNNGDANGWYLLEEILNSVADAYQWPNMQAIERTEIFLNPMHHERFTGKFYSAENPESIAEIYSKDNKLFFKTDPQMPSMQLHLELEDQFFTKEENQKIYFEHHNNRCTLNIQFQENQIWGQSKFYYK